MTAPPGYAQAERAAREAYGRLVAWLAWQWRDVAAAEDAMGEAFVAALEHWPRDGVPTAPEAWLLTAARRQLLMRYRHDRLAQAPQVLAVLEQAPWADEAATIPDRRLQLLCACVHPAVPEALHALCEALYGAYTVGSELASPAPEADAALCDEALFLTALAARLQPQQAEVHGLLALMLHAQARRPAQFGADGGFVPLTQQDTARWSRELMQQGEAALRHAAALRAPGPFQIEAAIQSAHNQRAHTGTTPWAAIAELYALLVAHTGAVGTRIGQAVAVGEAGDAAAALRLLDVLPADGVIAYQPYWVARSHLLQRCAREAEAETARARAIGLTADARVRQFLAQPMAEAKR